MNVRLIVLSTVVASATLFSMSAKAHDPAEFDRLMQVAEVQKKPTTCAQLADTNNYSNDVANADIKALKLRCDKAAAKAKAAAETKAAAKARAEAKAAAKARAAAKAKAQANATVKPAASSHSHSH